MVTVESWGRLESRPHDWLALPGRSEVPRVLAGHHPGLAFGMGRSYGDACLNPDGRLWGTTGLDRFIHFDPETGQLQCEAGVLLRDIQRLMLPRGWMLPVTPGTQLVTVGGAIANDVHGKNHHVQGSFGDHVHQLTLVRTDGQVIDCGPDTTPNARPDWFAATVGGIGLTGVITRATLQLRKVAGPWLDSETVPYYSLDEFFALADSAEAQWEHTVSWIDCRAGARLRGLFMRANHSSASQGPLPANKKRGFPFVPPVSLVNQASLGPFNFMYFHANRIKPARALCHYEPFFYPLDNILNWNRMYGPRGFYQYQLVVPRASGNAAVQALLDEIARANQGSFLAVLKTFGQRQPVGMLSFAMPGVTLALDFPNLGAPTLQLFERLDSIVQQAGGRLYLAKDARMPRRLFEAGYPRRTEFLPYRDPGISSAMSRRLLGS